MVFLEVWESGWVKDPQMRPGRKKFAYDFYGRGFPNVIRISFEGHAPHGQGTPPQLPPIIRLHLFQKISPLGLIDSDGSFYQGKLKAMLSGYRR
jgi:hypothetical protein